MENSINKNNSLLKDLAAVIPAFFVLFSLIAVRSHFSYYPMSQYYWHTAMDDTVMEDMFAYWKSVFVLIGAGLGIVYTTCQLVRKKLTLNKEPVYLAALVFIGFTVLSLAFSNHKYIALHGANEHFEGTFVLIAYIAIVIYLKLAITNRRQVKMVIGFTFVMAFIACLVGITQALGNDFFQTVTGMKLITPYYTTANGATTWQVIEAMDAIGIKSYDFTFTDGQVYQTTYNINYVPFYLCLVLSLIAFLVIGNMKAGSGKKYALSAILLAFFGLIMYNFFYAKSANGYLGLAVIGIVSLIIFRKYILKWIVPLICLVAVLCIVLAATVSIWLPELTHSIDSISSVLPGEYAYADGPVKYTFEYPAASQYRDIDYIETGDTYINFSIGGNVLNIRTDDNRQSIGFFDGEGSPLQVMMVADSVGDYDILDERYYEYVSIKLSKTEDQNIITLKTAEVTWDFTEEDNHFVYINKYGKYVSLRRVPHSTLIKDYDFGSGRGYIWDTTIPMLGDRLLIGSGADTFVAVFPQDDYATSYSYRGETGLHTLTDKAHNFYLQTWVNTGLISLIAWIFMVGCYLVSAVIYFRKHHMEDILDFINAGIFVGICGFLASAVLNDGSLSTMPIFYTVLGLGFAINGRDAWEENMPVNKEEELEQEVMPTL